MGNGVIGGRGERLCTREGHGGALVLKRGGACATECNTAAEQVHSTSYPLRNLQHLHAATESGRGRHRG